MGRVAHNIARLRCKRSSCAALLFVDDLIRWWADEARICTGRRCCPHGSSMRFVGATKLTCNIIVFERSGSISITLAATGDHCCCVCVFYFRMGWRCESSSAAPAGALGFVLCVICRDNSFTRGSETLNACLPAPVPPSLSCFSSSICRSSACSPRTKTDMLHVENSRARPKRGNKTWMRDHSPPER